MLLLVLRKIHPLQLPQRIDHESIKAEREKPHDPSYAAGTKFFGFSPDQLSHDRDGSAKRQKK